MDEMVERVTGVYEYAPKPPKPPAVTHCSNCKEPMGATQHVNGSRKE